jgi:hypothetical protein
VAWNNIGGGLVDGMVLDGIDFIWADVPVGRYAVIIRSASTGAETTLQEIQIQDGAIVMVALTPPQPGDPSTAPGMSGSDGGGALLGATRPILALMDPVGPALAPGEYLAVEGILASHRLPVLDATRSATMSAAVLADRLDVAVEDILSGRLVLTTTRHSALNYPCDPRPYRVRPIEDL